MKIIATIAALYVETGGCYFDLPGIIPWDEGRDARAYPGPHPVVAHPPCQRWGKLWAGQPLHIKRTGERKVKGADGGCFAAALAATRRWGGIIEHPWGSHAWAHFGLNKPPRHGGWIAADFHGGWTCCVEQGRYGHYARKPTLLLAYHVDLPELDWGIGECRLYPAVIERMGLKRAKRLGEVGSKGGGTDSTPRIGTPAPFRELLISIARTSRRIEETGMKIIATMLVLGMMGLAGCSTEHCWVVDLGFDRDYYSSSGKCGRVQGGGDTMPGTYWAVVIDRPFFGKYYRDRAQAIAYVETYCKVDKQP